MVRRNKGFKYKIRSSLYLRYHAEACNEWRGPSPRRSAWAAQLRKDVAMVRAVGDTVSDSSNSRFKPKTFRTDSNVLSTELTGRWK